jgi:hypothetical protein
MRRCIALAWLYLKTKTKYIGSYFSLSFSSGGLLIKPLNLIGSAILDISISLTSTAPIAPSARTGAHLECLQMVKAWTKKIVVPIGLKWRI